jgi:uncharacterized membrane protein
MMFRSVLFGMLGAISGALGIVLASLLDEPAPWVVFCAAGAGGFLAGAFVNFVCEYFGLYRIDLLKRLIRRRD